MRIKNSKEEVEELQEETRRRPDSEDDQEEAGYETKGKPDPALCLAGAETWQFRLQSRVEKP